ncbi:hypothetical protein, partial [Pseudomonas sp. 2995-3]|uniref:hypothetical protein n=1 Tax=Pseudomonas sp. 2995-3 TaxID=1712680 RepID=UPI001C46DEE1
ILNELMIEDEPFIVEIDKTEEDKVGYFLVNDFSNNMYNVVVGYDGVKISTITALDEMNNIAEMMFDIVQSVEK